MIGVLLGSTLTMTLTVLSAPASHGDVILGQPKPLKVVLLGDSYAAGNGARDADGNTDFYGPDGCLRSHSNWAEQYVDRLREDDYNVTFINRACSGAVFDHLTNRREMDDRYAGSFLLPDVGLGDEEAALEAIEESDPCREVAYDDEEFDYEVAQLAQPGRPWSVSCTRYISPQLDAVNADTDLVLLTMGGNDAQFRDVVTYCFSPLRSAFDCQRKVEASREAIPTIRTGLNDMVEEMRERGLRDDARVVLGGYPLLALDNGVGLVDADPYYEYAAADQVRALGRTGDDEIAATAADLSLGHPDQVVHLDGIPELFEGHEPDASTAAKNPDRWIFEIDEGDPWFFGDFSVKEVYHPNPEGHYEYARHLALGGTYGAATTPSNGGDIDIAFVLDATGSMGGDIEQMRQYMSTVIDQVDAVAGSARYSLASYRDQPQWTGNPSDYAGRLDQPFTYDGQEVKAAMAGVVASGGGDTPESVYSGVMEALDQSWRPGVKKVVIVLADAPPHEPEPVSGLSFLDVYEKAFSLDPAEVYLIDTYRAGSAAMMELVNRSGGVRIDASTTQDVPGALSTILTTALDKPYAWLNGPYVARVGSTLTLDGSGSYATNDQGLTYEWDYDQDGVYDETTTSPLVDHQFTEAFNGVLTLRVTDSEGRSSLATTHLGITDDGDETPRERDNCPDVANHGQDDYDEDGIGDACDPVSGYPTEDVNDVSETGVGAQWPFEGFEQPVATLPSGNTVNAGRSIPMKFRLGEDRGDDVLVDGSPSSRRISCDNGSDYDALTEGTSSPSGLNHAAGTDRYTYVWNTPTSWAGTCRMFSMRLADGSTHEALFRFR